MKASFALFALFAAAIMSGCSPAPTETASGTGEASSAAPVATTLPAGLTEYKNKDGKLECPFMKAPIASADKAEGFVDHEGVRYYLCCGMCVKKAEKDPKSAKEAAERA